MKVSRHIRRLTHRATRSMAAPALMLTAALCAPFLSSCDGAIYDDEEDCDPHYRVRFTYRKNLKFADAFPSEVREVTLYVIDDATGEIVWQKHEDGAELREEGYLMDIPVDPGRYTLLAWCGEGHRSSFGISDEPGVKTDLECLLLQRHEAPADHPFAPTGTHVDTRIGDLYHGRLDAQEFPETEGEYVYTVDLMKDTNDVHIVLQHLSGEPVDANDFTFTLTEDNGHMDWDNSLIPESAPVTYFSHDTRSGTAGVEVPDYTKPEGEQMLPAETRVQTQVSCAVANLTVGRLMADRKAYISIYNKENRQVVANIPLTDYALLVRGNDYGHNLTDQEYLDYRDDYSLVFFLDENDRWVNTSIYINSWRLVLQHTGI